jgi:hypothetical protein
MSWRKVAPVPFMPGCAVRRHDFSVAALNKTRECLLDMPTVALLAVVVGCVDASLAKVNNGQRGAIG